jgi:hypothetical protein
MIKITKDVVKNPVKVKRMGKMKPLETGRIVGGKYDKHIVMRTFCIRHFEVMDLSDPGVKHCWDKEDSDEYVEPLDAVITLEIS